MIGEEVVPLKPTSANTLQTFQKKISETRLKTEEAMHERRRRMKIAPSNTVVPQESSSSSIHHSRPTLSPLQGSSVHTSSLIPPSAGR